jgi:hypothetical protein
VTENKLINIVLDATMLDTFQSCPAKFNYRFNLNKSTTDKATPLDKGGLVHIGLEAYYSAFQQEIEFDRRVEIMHQAVQIAWSTDSDLATEMFGRVQEVLREYAVRWRAHDERSIIKIHSIETPFIYVLHEDDLIRISMIGKIDLLVDYKDGNQTYNNLVIDHKSYERDFPVRRLTNQFCNYAYAAESSYLLVNRVGFQKTIAPEVKHKRVPLSYDAHFLEQWKQNTIKICYDYLECVSEKQWPMNLTSCDKYNRMCEYYDVCDTSGTEGKIWKLQTLYQTLEKWDVSKSLGVKSEG